jgi:Flp pilus assembly protein TadB
VRRRSSTYGRDESGEEDDVNANPATFRRWALVAVLGAVILAAVALLTDMGRWWTLAFAILALGGGRLYWAALREEQRQRHEEELLERPQR